MMMMTYRRRQEVDHFEVIEQLSNRKRKSMVFADLHEELSHAPARILGDARALDEEGGRHHRVGDEHVVISELVDMLPPLHLLRLHPATINIMTSRICEKNNINNTHPSTISLAAFSRSFIELSSF